MHETLKSTEPNTLEPILDIDHSRVEVQETEATPEDYEKFSHHYFSELLDALDNPQLNASPADEEAINDQLVIAADLLVSTNPDDSDPEQSHPKDVFANLANKYADTSQANLQQGQERIAERNHRLVGAVGLIEDKFNTYIATIHPQSAEPAPSNGLSLPNDAIE